ncbi:hypothetical protein FJT64_023830 [Amphibalanus amphitrite]|uniref:Uncharacterized protein n=1 Tax=Amphibalanus amphitrite TaxID=1232801 RepID=A0A6A4WP07_AMPAM|nr:hypothetical protein FJT64_023830 [Amphibalanus amphitrite]
MGVIPASDSASDYADTPSSAMPASDYAGLPDSITEGASPQKSGSLGQTGIDFGAGIEVTPLRPGQSGHHNPFAPDYKPPPELSQAWELTGGRPPAPAPTDTQRPPNRPFTQVPPNRPPAQKPTNINRPFSQKPANKPFAQKPVNKPFAQVPANRPFSQKPVNKPACDPYSGYLVTDNYQLGYPITAETPTVAMVHCQLGGNLVGVCCRKFPKLRPQADGAGPSAGEELDPQPEADGADPSAGEGLDPQPESESPLGQGEAAPYGLPQEAADEPSTYGAEARREVP